MASLSQPGMRAISDWLKLFKIEIESGSTSLYNNGRQQVAILLTVEPLNGQTITPEQLGSLTVVEARDDGSFVELPKEESTAGWWMSNDRNVFDYFPGSAATKHTGIPDNSTLQLVHRYIMTSAQGGTVKRLRAQITQDPENTYVSKSEPEGEVKLASVSTIVFAPDRDYDFVKTPVSGSESTNNVIYEYRLNPTSHTFVDDPSEDAANLAPAGMIQWADKLGDSTYASHVGYARVGDPMLIYNTQIKLPDDFKNQRMARSAQNKVRGTLTIVLQGDRDIPYDSASANQQNGPCSIRARDNNGTLHELRVQFSPESRYTLELH